MATPMLTNPAGFTVNDPRGPPQMYIRTLQGGVIRSLFDALKDIVHDVVLRVYKTDIRLACMDNAQCALVHLKLNADAFEDYVVDLPDGKPIELGINVANVYKLVRAASSHDAVSFARYDTSPNVLEIMVQNFDRNSATLFAVNLLDVNNEEVELDNVEFDNTVSIPSGYFQRLCRDMSDLAQHMRICSDGVTVSVGCKGSFGTQTTVLGESDASLSVIASNKTVVEQWYSLKYLVNFCKASALSPSVELFLKKDFPLILNFGVAGLGTLKFALSSIVTDA